MFLLSDGWPRFLSQSLKAAFLRIDLVKQKFVGSVPTMGRFGPLLAPLSSSLLQILFCNVNFNANFLSNKSKVGGQLILYTIEIQGKMVTIVWVIWNLEYHQQNAVPKKMRTTLRSLIFLYPIMGSTWLFGLFSFSHHSPFVYQYLFSLFNAFQGVFMLLFHCLFQPGNFLTLRCQCAVNSGQDCFKHSCSYYWYIGKTSKFRISHTNEFSQNIHLEIFDKLCSSGTKWRLRGILTCQINPLKKPMKALPPTSPENGQELRKIEYRKSLEKPLNFEKKPLAPLVPKKISKDLKPQTTNTKVKLFFLTKAVITLSI